jgi:hypothetical protein
MGHLSHLVSKTFKKRSLTVVKGDLEMRILIDHDEKNREI